MCPGREKRVNKYNPDGDPILVEKLLEKSCGISPAYKTGGRRAAVFIHERGRDSIGDF